MADSAEPSLYAQLQSGMGTLHTEDISDFDLWGAPADGYPHRGGEGVPASYFGREDNSGCRGLRQSRASGRLEGVGEDPRTVPSSDVLPCNDYPKVT